MKETRRDFIKKTGGCALGMVTLATQMQHMGAISAMAQKVIDSTPELVGDYKALVLVSFGGGNDGNNMVIPNHNDATISNWTTYNILRTPQGPATGGLAFPQAQLLPISVPLLGGLTYGLHPSLGPQVQNGTTIVNNGIHDLYNLGKLAVVANVGTLVRPLTKAQYLSSAYKKPYQLFSHSDQVTEAQTCRADAQAFTGWGGRLADKMNVANNPNGLIPMVTSIAGAQLFTAGQVTLPMAIGQANLANGAATSNLRTVLTPAGLSGTAATTTARLNAFNALRTQDLDSNYIAAASHVTDLAMQANSALQTSQDVTVTFPNTTLGMQLKQVARLIKSRTDLSVSRQVFYVQVGGSFDTHTLQITSQANLLTQVSQGMRAFWDEINAQGIQDSVTTFTLSDFCRTMQPAGIGPNVGSDHAWGNHVFVMGGAVAGGDFYGCNRPDGTGNTAGSGNIYPTLVTGPSGLDDTDNSTTPSANRGRWIPTTSVDQYAVRLARWFGLSPADEAAVFPNLINFNDTGANPSIHLDFML